LLCKMRGSYGLVLILALGVHCTGALQIWEDGKEYIFREESAVQVGTSDHATTASGFRLMSDVKVQVSGQKLVVSSTNVQEAHYSHLYPEGGWPYRLLQEKDKQSKSMYIPSIGLENGYTFAITLEDGLVSSIELPKELSPNKQLSNNAKNMMRALASILQIDISGYELGMWTKRERSIHGECDFEYTFMKDDYNEYQEISKAVSHIKDCKKRKFKLFDNSDSHSCNLMQKDRKISSVEDMDMYSKMYRPIRENMFDDLYHPAPIHSTSMTTYLMKELEPQKLEIQKIFSAGSVMVQMYMENGPTHVTLANRTLTLVESRGLSTVEAVSDPEVLDTLDYHWMETETVWNEPLTVEDLKIKESFFYNGITFDESQKELIKTLKTNIKEYLEEMDHYHDPSKMKDEAITKLHQHGIHKLLPIFHALDYNSLNELKEFYLNSDNMESRNIFFELLPIAGTWPASLIIRDIVLNNDFKSDIETARLLTSMPFHVEPVQALVEEFFKLVISSESHLMWPFTRSALDLSYAHLVRKACHDLSTQEQCFKALHIEDFIKRFDALEVDNFVQLQHMMLVLFNFHESDILENKLKDILYDNTPKKYDYSLKTIAAFALGSRAIRKGIEKDVFLPIFLNRNEHHELRIAAFDMLMNGFLTTSTFNKIMTYMIYETDFEVFNYVYTAFENFATQYNEPCGKMVHEYAKYFIKYWKQHMWQKPKYTIGVSNRFSHSFIQDKYGYSGSMDFHTFGSHKAAAPLGIMVDVRTQRYHHATMQNFGMFLRAEGFAERIFDKIKEFTQSKELKFERLRDILFSGMNIREHPHVPAKLCIIFMLRDTVVFEYHLFDNELGKMFDKFLSLIKQVKNLNNLNQVFRKYFGLDWTTFVYEQPTDMGVPMAYVSGALSMIGFEGAWRKDLDWNGELNLKTRMNTISSDLMTIVHPEQKILFSIAKETGHKLQLETRLIATYDMAMKKMLMALKVPKTKSPMSLVSHGHTFILTRDNKIRGGQLYMEKSCPSCLMMETLSKGPQYKSSRDLISHEYHDLGHIYGLEVEGRLFDCEIPEASTQGQIYLALLNSFSPIFKEPKTLLNMLISGMRKIIAFSMYYPKAESCGLQLMLSQGLVDPVEEIIFEFDLSRVWMIMHPNNLLNEYNLLTEKKLYMKGDIVFYGLVNRTHDVEFMLYLAPMGTKTHLDINILRKPFTLQSKIYEKFPIEFHMKTLSEMIEIPLRLKDLQSADKTRVQTSMELIWGNPDVKVMIEGDFKTTAEAMDHLRSKWYYKTCMDQHLLPEWRMTEDLPMTDACLYALHDLYTLCHYHWDITATNLEPWMVSAYKKIETLIKTTFFPFWEFKPEYSKHAVVLKQPRIHIDQIFNTKKNTFDLTLKVQNDISKFKDVNYWYWSWNNEPYLSLSKLTLLTRANFRPELITTLFYNNIINHCIATSQTMRTYDNVTYPYHMDHKCWTLISSDCSEHPSFAVFMRKEEKLPQQLQLQEQKAPLGLMVFLGDQVIELLPLDTHEDIKLGRTPLETHKDHTHHNNHKFDLKINSQGPFDLHDKDFMYFAIDQEPTMNQRIVPNYLFKIMRRQNMFVLDFFPYMMLRYDGHFIQVLTGPQIMGRHCGMCGDYNRNMHHELVDPQRCHLTNGDEMALAWTWDAQFCQDKVAKPACTMTEPFI